MKNIRADKLVWKISAKSANNYVGTKSSLGKSLLGVSMQNSIIYTFSELEIHWLQKNPKKIRKNDQNNRTLRFLGAKYAVYADALTNRVHSSCTGVTRKKNSTKRVEKESKNFLKMNKFFF